MRSGPGGSWTYGNCLEGQKGITRDLYSCLCQKKPLFCDLTSVLTCLSLLTQGAISEKLTYSCSYCEAAFTSKTQLEKHRLWNHLDRPVPTSKAENKVPKAIGKSSGKKRYQAVAGLHGSGIGMAGRRGTCLLPFLQPGLVKGERCQDTYLTTPL